MTSVVIDRLKRALQDRIDRRGLLGTGAAIGLAGAPALSPDAWSRKNRKKRKKGKKPVTVACSQSEVDLYSNLRRVAETFLAPRKGKITSASVFLGTNPADFSLTFEIRTVDVDGVPASTLGSSGVLNIPATSDEDRRKVTATFVPPVPVSANQRYALAVIAPSNVSFLYNDDSHCPDKESFYSRSPSGAWSQDSDTYDLVFVVKISA